MISIAVVVELPAKADNSADVRARPFDIGDIDDRVRLSRRPRLVLRKLRKSATARQSLAACRRAGSAVRGCGQAG
jgi:hypothetical protein